MPERFQPFEISESYQGIVTVNDKPIDHAWYGDTTEGVVKTFNVVGKISATAWKGPNGECWTPEDFPGREVDCPPDGILSETLRGKVRIFGPEVECPTES